MADNFQLITNKFLSFRNFWYSKNIRNPDFQKNRNSFTLIELLVVLALVAILSVVVVMTLNPAELIKQARDSNRLSDVATINTALNLFSADVTSGFMGTSTIVYVSIPDNTSSTCGSLGLPALPTGYTYNCATSQNLRKTDGTGWIPVNFQLISSNSPISQLPVDPINTTSTRLYYTYIAGGSWELNATIEASKNKLGGSGDLVSKDGGSATSLYETGNNLNLNPIETGDTSLVGYWNFEEGSGTIVGDKSGNGNNLNIYNNTTWSTGKIGYGISLPDINSGMDSGGTNYNLNTNINSYTSCSWFNLPATSPNTYPSILFGVSYASFGITADSSQPGGARVYAYLGGAATPAENFLEFAKWHHICATYNSGTATRQIYTNGSLTHTDTSGSPSDITANMKIGNLSTTCCGMTATAQIYVDETRFYNRALSAAEILAIYNATK